eukprot:1731-Heterococcus_DN1.PRE.1
MKARCAEHAAAGACCAAAAGKEQKACSTALSFSKIALEASYRPCALGPYLNLRAAVHQHACLIWLALFNTVVSVFTTLLCSSAAD